MRILVTGGAGFIGSHVADAFVAEGHDVAIVDDLSTGRQTNISNDVTFFQCDIRDEALRDVFTKFQPEIVSHHAAQISVPASIDNPTLDTNVNLMGGVNLLECARATSVRKVIYASTGGALYGEPEYLPCDESHPVAGLSHYAVSKYAFELYLGLYHRLYGLDYTILRYPNVYGPRQDPHGEAGVVAIFIGRMLAGDNVTIFGDGTQERDFVYVGDIARASIAALDKGSGQSMNLGSGLGTSINDIFQTLTAITDYTGTATYGPPRTGDVYKVYLTGDRARDILGWEPTVLLQKGLEETVRHFEAANYEPGKS